MKITAEFNTISEIQEFVALFNKNNEVTASKTFDVGTLQTLIVPKVAAEVVAEVKEKDLKKVESEKPKKVKEVKAEVAATTEEKVITKEDVRGVFTELNARGKAAESKRIVSSFDAKKLSDLKEENYKEAYEEARSILDSLDKEGE